MGDTYYFPPLNVHQFGVVDCSQKQDKLHAYVYREFEERRREGTMWFHVCFKTSRKRDTLTKKHEGDIALIADNCTGQSKNKTVTWFSTWLVETGVCPKVTLLFCERTYKKFL